MKDDDSDDDDQSSAPFGSPASFGHRSPAHFGKGASSGEQSPAHSNKKEMISLDPETVRHKTEGLLRTYLQLNFQVNYILCLFFKV